ncbi:hypothetical protein [Antrihabitans stalactiti]|jgi:hypothetical protein|uniref:Uncharacterized protein n=1 Tax=Antrihabitans stalactiti TaxID=2584121 RepID=A0A848KSU4_9NOCA|nr:hypothetical protein [Antrihabitans stalactiti]NMN99290.1 hypothetical protein [Antrihabitans stalactiti]
MTSPDEHGEEFRNNDANEIVNRIIVDQFEPEMHGTEAADLATKLVAVPIIPDGGCIGRTFGTRLRETSSVRDVLRVWSPGLSATALFVLCALVFPLTPPLVAYGIAMVGFGWWHAAGRPRLVAVLRMLFHASKLTLRLGAQVGLFLVRLARVTGRAIARKKNARRIAFGARLRRSTN